MKKENFSCWNNLRPECVHDYKGFSSDKIRHSGMDKTVKPANMLGGEGFSDMTHNDINCVIDKHSDKC